MQGATSGVGAAIARELASRGAQLILLTQHALNDPFLVDYIEDLREATQNELITAEQVDLSSLYSIRLFATKWVDNAPPRRLDMLILCANTLTPPGSKLMTTEDGLESNWGLNYVANFHLLSILSPAIRAQPPDRDVRIIFGMCASYMGGNLEAILPADSTEIQTSPSPSKPKSKPKSNENTTASAPPQPQPLSLSPSQAYATSKLALLTFAHAFQSHLSAYARPDKQPSNARVLIVDPGWSRTPGMRRYLSFGTLWGLLLYMIVYPFWWLVLKAPERGAQGFLHAAMEAGFAMGLGAPAGGVGDGAVFIKECGVRGVLKVEVRDEGVQKRLWEETEGVVERLERESAVRRARVKKEGEEKGKVEESRASKVEKEKTPGSRRSRKTGS